MKKFNRKYTASDIMNEIKRLLPTLEKKTKRRFHIDQRNYLISVLYYKFGFTEEFISELVNIERSSVCYAKKRVILSLEKEDDWTFEINTLHLSHKYPFKFPVELKKKRPYKLKQIYLNLSTLNKIELFKNKFNISDTDEALKALIGIGLNETKVISKPINVEFDL